MLPTDEAFIRLLDRRVPGVTQGEIRGSLQRAAFRIDYPEIGELLNERPGHDGPPDPVVEMPSKAAVAQSAEKNDRKPAEVNGRRSLLKTSDLVELGLLKPGARLGIKGRPDSTATVIDGRYVEFQGERLTYNAWGCRVTGWPSIQIYRHAISEDGRLLEELRQEAASTTDSGH